MSRFFSTVAALAIPATLSVGMVHADGFIDEAGGAARINYSGKLRMLSQRIPAAACNEAAGIAYDVSAAILESSVAEFDQIIAGLEHGDEALGMFGAEQDRKVLADIQAVHAIWDPLHVRLDAMIGGEVTAEHAEVIEHTSFELLEIAVHLTALVTAEYANPTELMQADAIIIDIAGRQRMLAQEISKDACMIATGVDVEEASAELVNAMDTYAVSLAALQNGLPEAGITPPPTEEIAAGLAEVAAQWSALEPILASIKAGNSASDEDRETLFLGMNTLTGQMNTIVGQYAEASKLGL